MHTILVAAHDLPAGRTLTSDDLRSGSWPAAQVPLGRLATGVGRVLAAPIRSGEPLTDARVVGPGLLAGQALGTVAFPVRMGEATVGSMVRAGDRVDVLASASASTISSTWTDPPDSTDSTAADGSNADTDSNADESTDESTGQNAHDSTSDDADTEPHADARPDVDRGIRSRTDDGSGVERVAASALVLAVPGAGSAGDTGLSGSTGTGLSGLTGSSPSGQGEVSTPGVLVLAVSSGEARRLAAAQAGRQLAIAVLPQP